MIDYTHLIGKLIVWKEHGQECCGTAEFDTKFSGKVKVAGRSITNIIDSCDWWKAV